MTRAEFEADLRQEGYEVREGEIKPNEHREAHAHGFDARVLVLDGSITLVFGKDRVTYGPGDSCSIDVRFSPTAAGARVGTLTVDCSPLPAVGGITITCDFDDTTIANIALNGLGAILAAVSVSVPTIGRYEMTALAMLLFALAAWSLRRKP